MMPVTPKDRGFVLINALVLVAALAVATVWMLGKAEDSRVRSASQIEVVQLGLYLDAAEAFAITLLDQERSGDVVHSGQAWAQARHDVAVDRGSLTLGMDDLQGRFNLNWLANPNDLLARESFFRLARANGVPPQRAEAIVDFLSPGGPSDTGAYVRARPPTSPVGGAVLMVDQIRSIPGLTDQEWTRLTPLVTALPGDTTLNVNTAHPAVLGSLLPGSNTQALGALTAQAVRTPYTSVDDFMSDLAQVTTEADIAAFDPARLGINSMWFALSAQARLGDRQVRRDSVLWRLPLPNPVLVSYRLDMWEEDRQSP